MKIPDVVCEYINQRLREIEQEYEIKVLFWVLRSSFNMGIYRQNSDADVYFVFVECGEKLNVIHDIGSHRFDMWGCSIRGVKENIDKNMRVYNSLEQKKLFIPQYINASYKKAGCNYVYGLFLLVGNECLYDPENNLHKYFRDELESFNRKLYIATLFYQVESDISKMEQQSKNSINDYLRIVWKLLYIKYVFHNGILGKYGLIYLLERVAFSEYDKVIFYLKTYRSIAETKDVMRTKDRELEETIRNFFLEIQEIIV